MNHEQLPGNVKSLDISIRLACRPLFSSETPTAMTDAGYESSGMSDAMAVTAMVLCRLHCLSSGDHYYIITLMLVMKML
jgi:hypothetical protein